MRNHTIALALAGLAAAASADAVVTFDNGAEGWSINGLDTPSPTGGNPGANLHWNDPIDTFGLEIRTDTNTDFIGDYSTRGPITIGIDIQTNYINFFGQAVSRDLVVEFRDYDNVSTGYPYASVWTTVGTLVGNNDWQRYEATIADPTQTTLPAGWGGTGDEDPNTFEPMLPADRTFADVLAGVDQVLFTTYVPGFFFGFTNFDLQVDNISIVSVPAPSTVGALACLGLVGMRRRR